MSVAHTFLFAVGNSMTRWGKLPTLPGVVQDVDNVFDALVEGGPGLGLADRLRSVKLLDKDAHEVRERWQDFINAVEIDALIVFYFAGHGALAGAHDLRLLLADSDPSRGDESTLSVRQVVQALENKCVAEWAVILDCCESSEVTRDRAIQGIRNRTNGGSLIVCATSSGRAWETPEQGGRFTSRLTDAIQTGSCMPLGSEFVDILRAATWAKDQLPETRPLIDHWGSADFRVAKILPTLIEIGRLPQSEVPLVGRVEYLKRLDAAWADGPEQRRVLIFVAWGGTGKTSLVTHWLAGLAAENYRGARRVLGWSFYSQGTGEGRVDSADEFIVWALEKLGDPKPNEGPSLVRAERLASRVREQRTLLVLDGIEPLQYPPGPEEGKLRDQALAVLLRSLCASSSGLCVVTSRLKLPALGAFCESIDLSQLGEHAGGGLLQDLGVRGSPEELRIAAREFGGHALALVLLGQLIVDAFDGNVRMRNEIGPLMHEEKRGGHARRVMARYEQWFDGKPERAVLNMLGLFDRPAREGALAAVREAPGIAGLTDLLVALDARGWKLALTRLRRARLIEPEDPHQPGTVDAHPLVREHFGELVREAHPVAWREGHRRLYEFHRTTAKDLPDTLAEMAPLYVAVHHGCRAGLHQEALDEVYWRRICREKTFYSAQHLGACGADLAALAGLFEILWTTPVTALSEDSRGWVLGEAGDRLRMLGRLREATAPLRRSLDAELSREDWRNAAIATNNLSELHLALGEIPHAIEFAQQSIQWADHTSDQYVRMTVRTTLADALHQAGDAEASARCFGEAEGMQKAHQPEYPRLYLISGFRYCNLLLDRGEVDETLKRGTEFFHWRRQGESLVEIALDHLTLGRAHLACSFAEHPNCHKDAFRELDAAVAGLREAGRQDHLPRGLLARAAFFTHTGEFQRAIADLDEVLELAERCSMKLFECDAHLGFTRLCLAQSDLPGAREHLGRARQLVAETGYGRRRPELDELNRRSNFSP